MPPINPRTVPTQSFSWGAIKWLVCAETTPEATLAFGQVLLQPGEGHSRHNHPDSEEILFVLSGEGEQMVGDVETFTVRAGDTIYIPQGVFHSTRNSGWEEMRVLAIYNPGGPEQTLAELPDFRHLPPGEAPAWVRREG